MRRCPCVLHKEKTWSNCCSSVRNYSACTDRGIFVVAICVHVHRVFRSLCRPNNVPESESRLVCHHQNVTYVLTFPDGPTHVCDPVRSKCSIHRSRVLLILITSFLMTFYAVLYSLYAINARLNHCLFSTIL